MIEYKHVALRYTEKDILKDVNLRIENGEFMMLVGPSGSGKTTMIKMVNRLLERTFFSLGCHLSQAIADSYQRIAQRIRYDHYFCDP